MPDQKTGNMQYGEVQVVSEEQLHQRYEAEGVIHPPGTNKKFLTSLFPIWKSWQCIKSNETSFCSGIIQVHCPNFISWGSRLFFSSNLHPIFLSKFPSCYILNPLPAWNKNEWDLCYGCSGRLYVIWRWYKMSWMMVCGNPVVSFWLFLGWLGLH